MVHCLSTIKLLINRNNCTTTLYIINFQHDTHLCSKKRSGTNPHPAVEGIEVGCVVCVVVVEHRTKPDNRQNERKEQKPSM